MDFQELLNDYMELFSCTAKELADASGFYDIYEIML